jgi:hypothetical protein
MPVFKINKDFGRPIIKLRTYYVKCGTCDRTEGQFVTALNRLTVGEGDTADKMRERGWRFESGEWVCPQC